MTKSQIAWVLCSLGLWACSDPDVGASDAAGGGASSGAGSEAAGGGNGASEAGPMATNGAANGDGAMAGSTGAASGDGDGALDELGPAPSDDPAAIEIGVKNACPFPVWIHAEGKQGVLLPDDQQLATGEVRWYSAPFEWQAARITAFGAGPRTGELEKVEMTLVPEGNAAVLNYNVTYVDWLGLPVSVRGIGSGADCESASCDLAHSSVLSGCPAFLLDGKRCLSPRSYCLNPTHAGEAECKQLDAEIARCASTKPGCEGAAGASTAEAFACSGFFASSPKWCAALNRAMLDDPDSTDLTKYYSAPPYNEYAKWVHEVCPSIYAFAYDDYPSNAGESGFHACTGGTALHVTFCPRG